MTRYTIPAADCLRHLHHIARRNGLTVSIDPVAPEAIAAGSPFRWVLTIANRDHAIIYATAVDRANELPEAIRDAWQDFVGRGIS